MEVSSTRAFIPSLCVIYRHVRPGPVPAQVSQDSTHLKISNSRYALRYLVPRRYGLNAMAGAGWTTACPTSLVMDDESWKEGSKTTRFFVPLVSFSKPMMVREWPDAREC